MLSYSQGGNRHREWCLFFPARHFYHGKDLFLNFLKVMRASDSEASMTPEFKLGEVNKFLSSLTQTTFLRWIFSFLFYGEEESSNLLNFMLPCMNWSKENPSYTATQPLPEASSSEIIQATSRLSMNSILTALFCLHGNSAYLSC